MKQLRILREPAALIAIAINLLLVAVGVYYNYTNQDLLTRYTKEDGVIEWMQFFMFLSCTLFMLYVVWNKPARERWSLVTLGQLGVAGIFFFGAMEEISWFQRIFELAPSQFFLTHNRQDETNIHNLVVNGVSINRLIFGKLLFLAVFSHNIVLPWWTQKRPALRQLAERFGFFFPPLRMSLAYLALVILVQLFIQHSRAKEHLEVVGAVHYLTSLFLTYGLGYFYDRPLVQTDREKTLLSSAFAIFLGFALLAAYLLGNMSLKGFMLK